MTRKKCITTDSRCQMIAPANLDVGYTKWGAAEAGGRPPAQRPQIGD